ncbi:tetratricopeptide repeat protein [Thiothrix eikelboomii]|uniref:tetratricopeptide repeat protein n=1 Tax=Thiothrix eikelboomii TaxID=92487 RepID=UPI003BB100B7
MKAFRWLLVHPIAFAWILAAIAIVLNWIVGSGAPPKKEHQAKAGQHEVQAQQEPAGHEAVAANQAAAGHEAASTTAQAAAALPAADASATQQQAAAEQASATGSASVTEQVAAGAAPAEAATATANQAAGQAVNENSSAEDLLLAAREAYWSGEYDRSVSFYQSLLKKDNQPDYKGELANVYWKQGKSTEAVSLYAEIAPWLAEQGRVAELQSIKVYADVVDPTKAAEIGAAIK